MSQNSTENNRKQKILVIDDDRLSSHNLNVQLKFVGEQPVMVHSDQWAALAATLEAEANEKVIVAIVVGQVKNQPLENLLNELVGARPEVSILLVAYAGNQVLQLDQQMRERLLILDEKSLNYQSLTAALQQARSSRGLTSREHNSRIMSNIGSALFRSLSGSSKSIEFVRHQINQVAKRDVSVLVVGESGAGKEVVARNLHYHSGRGDFPFVAVNCAAIIPSNNGVELFGHAEVDDQGRARSGFLELAEGGTLYLDEVNALPMDTQVLLLRFLEDKVYHLNGSGMLRQADVRVIAGTSSSLPALIDQGRFRKDLYFRLNLMPIELPPLRKRLGDIPDLVRELLQCLKSKDYELVSLNQSALDALGEHQWPGNVRELANLIERLCIMHPGEVIGVSDLPLEYQQSGDTEALLEEIEALTDKVESRAAGQRSDSSLRTTLTDEEQQALLQETDEEPEAGAGAAVADHMDTARTSASLLPLNNADLKNYLQNFEKQLLTTAMEDSANILSFAAERLQLAEEELSQRITALDLQGF